MWICTKCPFDWKKPHNGQFILCAGEKLFCTLLLLAVSPSFVFWPPRLRGGRGNSELLAWALNSIWQIDACFGNLGTQRWEHRASSPFPWSGTFPFQLAEHRSHRNVRSNSSCRRKEHWFFIFLTSCSFAPCCFCFQEGGAIIVILWDACCNIGIGKLAWGKGSRLCSKLDAKCVGRNLETSFFREGRQYQSLNWWCLAFCGKQSVPVAVTLTDRSCCPSQLLLLGCCRSRVLLCHAGSILWCLLCPCQQLLILFFFPH